MLDNIVKEQVKDIFTPLEADFTLKITRPSGDHEQKDEMIEMMNDIASTNSKITCVEEEGDRLSFTILKNGEKTGLFFRSVPSGHEFSSFLLAMLNLDGKGKNFPDEAIRKRVQALKTPIRLTTYVSLACTNCPDTVQALNLMSVLNSGISHEMVDGGLYQEEVERLKIKAVPTVYADGKLLHTGKSEFGELLAKLEEQYGSTSEDTKAALSTFYNRVRTV